MTLDLPDPADEVILMGLQQRHSIGSSSMQQPDLTTGRDQLPLMDKLSVLHDSSAKHGPGRPSIYLDHDDEPSLRVLSTSKLLLGHYKAPAAPGSTPDSPPRGPLDQVPTTLGELLHVQSGGNPTSSHGAMHGSGCEHWSPSNVQPPQQQQRRRLHELFDSAAPSGEQAVPELTTTSTDIQPTRPLNTGVGRHQQLGQQEPRPSFRPLSPSQARSSSRGRGNSHAAAILATLRTPGRSLLPVTWEAAGRMTTAPEPATPAGRSLSYMVTPAPAAAASHSEGRRATAPTSTLASLTSAFATAPPAAPATHRAGPSPSAAASFSAPKPRIFKATQPLLLSQVLGRTGREGGHSSSASAATSATTERQVSPSGTSGSRQQPSLGLPPRPLPAGPAPQPDAAIGRYRSPSRSSAAPDGRSGLSKSDGRNAQHHLQHLIRTQQQQQQQQQHSNPGATYSRTLLTSGLSGTAAGSGSIPGQSRTSGENSESWVRPEAAFASGQERSHMDRPGALDAAASFSFPSASYQLPASYSLKQGRGDTGAAAVTHTEATWPVRHEQGREARRAAAAAAPLVRAAANARQLGSSLLDETLGLNHLQPLPPLPSLPERTLKHLTSGSEQPVSHSNCGGPLTPGVVDDLDRPAAQSVGSSYLHYSFSWNPLQRSNEPGLAPEQQQKLQQQQHGGIDPQSAAAAGSAWGVGLSQASQPTFETGPSLGIPSDASWPGFPPSHHGASPATSNHQHGQASPQSPRLHGPGMPEGDGCSSSDGQEEDPGRSALLAYLQIKACHAREIRMKGKVLMAWRCRAKRHKRSIQPPEAEGWQGLQEEAQGPGVNLGVDLHHFHSNPLYDELLASRGSLAVSGVRPSPDLDPGPADQTRGDLKKPDQHVRHTGGSTAGASAFISGRAAAEAGPSLYDDLHRMLQDMEGVLMQPEELQQQHLQQHMQHQHQQQQVPPVLTRSVSTSVPAEPLLQRLQRSHPEGRPPSWQHSAAAAAEVLLLLPPGSGSVPAHQTSDSAPSTLAAAVQLALMSRGGTVEEALPLPLPMHRRRDVSSDPGTLSRVAQQQQQQRHGIPHDLNSELDTNTSGMQQQLQLRQHSQRRPPPSTSNSRQQRAGPDHQEQALPDAPAGPAACMLLPVPDDIHSVPHRYSSLAGSAFGSTTSDFWNPSSMPIRYQLQQQQQLPLDASEAAESPITPSQPPSSQEQQQQLADLQAKVVLLQRQLWMAATAGSPDDSHSGRRTTGGTQASSSKAKTRNGQSGGGGGPAAASSAARGSQAPRRHPEASRDAGPVASNRQQQQQQGLGAGPAHVPLANTYVPPRVTSKAALQQPPWGRSAAASRAPACSSSGGSKSGRGRLPVSAAAAVAAVLFDEEGMEQKLLLELQELELSLQRRQI